ncbi:MAG: class II aldolase/adducin family protein, partial [Ardenticatenaceae bacterium]
MSSYGRAAREQELREEIVEAGRRMQAMGFAAGSDGNLSARIEEGRILITPGGLSKGLLHSEQLLVVDEKGELQDSFHPMRRELRPSSEMNMHLEAYRQRSDVHAVIHAHPPMAIACTVANVSLADCVLPEIIYHLGSIPTAPYATPGTPEGAASVRELVRHHDAILLDHHGSLTLGDRPLAALMRLEWVEQAAKVMLAAHTATAGRVAELPAEQVERI